MTEGTKTTYVVLRLTPRQHGEGSEVGAWEEARRVSATSAKAAIAQCVGETSGSYVAVPARSFQPVQVTVEQRATLQFGEPKPKEPDA